MQGDQGDQQCKTRGANGVGGSAKCTVHGGTHHLIANATEEACNPDPGSATAPAACDLTEACSAELSSVLNTTSAIN